MSRLLLPFLVVALAGCAASEPRDPAEALHFDAIVVDGHSDTTPRFADPGWDFAERHDDADGDMDALVAAHNSGSSNNVLDWFELDSEEDGTFHGTTGSHELDEDLDSTAAVADGKLVSLMGIEGGHIIEESLPALRLFHRLGVRYLTLTHSFNTTWADSSGTTTIPEPTHGGLTDFGRDVVREMNRLGMLVDVSHVSDATFFDAVETSHAPVIASHSSVRAVADHTRNMSDDMLRALATNGGVVMINFYPAYIDEATSRATSAWFAQHGPTLMEWREAFADDPQRLAAERAAFFAVNPVPVCDLEVLLDHFDHAIEVAGPDHVGLGADWDGVVSMPMGMEDVAKLPDLTAGLLARGHSPETVRKVLGENVLRVLEEAERVAAAIQTEEAAAP